MKNSIRHSCERLVFGFASMLMVGIGVSESFARDYTWELPEGGAWADGANWGAGAGDYPNAPDVVAIINRDLSDSAVIKMPEEGISVGGLELGLGGHDGSVASWTLDGSRPLTFASSGGASHIRISGGIHVINTPIILQSDLVVEADHGVRLLHSRPLIERQGSWSITVERGRLDMRMRADYSGGTVIKSGASILAVRPNSVGVGPVSVEDGGRFVFVHEGGLVENSFTIRGIGEGYGALRMGSEMVESVTERQLIRLEERSAAPVAFRSGGFSGMIELVGEAAIAVASEGDGQIVGEITGDGVLLKLGAGRLVLENTNAYHGGTRIVEGILGVVAEGALPAGAPLDLAGGILEVGTSQNVSVLVVSENAVIRLPDQAAGTLTFGDSSRVGWAGGKTLVIEGWSGDQSGGRFKIGFGGGAGGLTAQQLRQVQFRDSADSLVPARLLPNGELVPQT